MPAQFFSIMQFEWTVLLILVIILILRLGKKMLSTESLLLTINAMLVVNLVAGFFSTGDGYVFGDMFYSDALVRFQKNILNLGVLIISLQSYQWLRSHAHTAEFYMILLASLLGMFFMISSRNMFMLYLSLELSAIPLAALANFDLHLRRSGEAAMKFIISSAFSSGILLMGISLIYGAIGSLNYEQIGLHMTGEPLLIFGFICLFAGFAFKMSAVPFHLWTADVYEGAPVAVTSYLSVISKGAVVFVFITALYQVFRNIFETWYQVLFLISVLTMITGNLFAIRQQNIKRFLAFSSIAQIGFILIGISGNTPDGTAASVYFILIYIFSNLAAFGVISLVSSATGRENIDDYRGFYSSNPLLAWVLTLALFSLAGIPPTAGFFGKFFLLMSGAARDNNPLIIIAALNMIVSLYYYLRVVKAMFMDEQPQPIQKLHPGWMPAAAYIICVIGMLATGLIGGAYEYIASIVQMPILSIPSIF